MIMHNASAGLIQCFSIKIIVAFYKRIMDKWTLMWFKIKERQNVSVIGEVNIYNVHIIELYNLSFRWYLYG